MPCLRYGPVDTMAAMQAMRQLPAVFRLALCLVILAATSFAGARAASHAAGLHEVARVMPCHQVIDAGDHLAPPQVDACATLCAGSAPELTFEAALPRSPLPDAALPIPVAVAECLAPQRVAEAAFNASVRAPPDVSISHRNLPLLI